MATKPTPNKTKPKTTKKVEKEKTNEPSFMQVVCGNLYDTLRSQKLWVSIGVIIICTSLFLIISFIGNIQLGYIDQASLEEGMPTAAQNYCGRWGAIVSDYFMAKCFGIFAFCIPIFGICLGLKCIGAQRVVLRKCFIQCVLWLVWGSVAASVVGVYLADYANLRLTFPLGGEHGDEVRKFMDLQIGVAGTISVLSVLALCYLIFVSSKTIIFIRTLLNPTDYIKSKLPKREAESGEAAEEETEQTAETEGEQLAEVQTEEGALTVDLTTGEVIAETPEAEKARRTMRVLPPLTLNWATVPKKQLPRRKKRALTSALRWPTPIIRTRDSPLRKVRTKKRLRATRLRNSASKVPTTPRKTLRTTATLHLTCSRNTRALMCNSIAKN